MSEMKNFVTVDGRVYLNTTPHDINCLNEAGEVVVLPTGGVLLNAKPVERLVKQENGVEFVTTVFEASPEGMALLDEIEATQPGCIVIGSIIAAQAYPERVCGLVPCKGYERVAPAEKRMRLDKFTVYTK